MIDHELCTCVHKVSGYDLLNLGVIKPNIIKSPLPFSPEKHKALKELKKAVIADVTNHFPQTRSRLDKEAIICEIHPVATIRSHIEHLVSQQRLDNLDLEYKVSYSDLFPSDIPHVSNLPQDVLMSIKLHDTQKPMVAHVYSCPQRYHEAWGTLIEQHLAAGQI